MLTFKQPPRTQPKVYLLQVKTHKLSIHLTLPPTATLAELKQEAFDALTSDVAEPLTYTGLPPTEADVVPRVTSLEDFELCRAVKEKGKMTGEFVVIETDDLELKLSGLSGWEVLFVQFRDKKSGLLLPARFTLPPIDDEEEDAAPPLRSSIGGTPSNTTLGKRKAREQE
ncbi:hypothetical protein AN958_05667 [Leucoagaricus sp. SymC.cos]|nr:hypothetical protein AN958_05667 [Leucoagaricus sp. SymC.cos]